MAFASEALSPSGLPRLQVPAFPAGQARRLARTGLALGLVAGGSLAVLAVSLSVASVWTRAVSHNAPTTLQMSAPTAPLMSALGEWHRGMVRAAAHSGPASGFGTAPDSEPQEIDLAPALPPALPQPRVAPQPPAPVAAASPPVHVPIPRRRPAIHMSEAAPPAPPPPAVAPPVMTAEVEPVPLPQARPRIAAAEPPETTASIPRTTSVPAPAPEPKLASLPPPGEPKAPASPIGPRTAVYDIESHTVYMPNGRRLEAHSGLGDMMDDPHYIRVRMRGPTPPNVYALTLREQLFHGVRAIRLTPVDEHRMFGRDGMLAHTYMLGPNGQSNGCVSFKNYNAFLEAFLDGQVDRMVVVPRLDRKTREALSLPQQKWSLFSAFAAE
jgi:hypothetical protein